jgi:hypothetical protein
MMVVIVSCAVVTVTVVLAIQFSYFEKIAFVSEIKSHTDTSQTHTLHARTVHTHSTQREQATTSPELDFKTLQKTAQVENQSDIGESPTIANLSVSSLNFSTK